MQTLIHVFAEVLLNSHGFSGVSIGEHRLSAAVLVSILLHSLHTLLY